jgi:cytochrome c oxidase subunit 3
MAMPTTVSGWLGYLPFYNTVILLTSSWTVHIAHIAIKEQQRTKLVLWLGITVLLGMVFLVLQVEEYIEAYDHMGLTLGSGIYGSTFFLLTGFHGFHVTLGTFILLVQFLRAVKGHFTAKDCFGFEAASWYWHFVDVVWVGLFIFVYVL